jgi:integrase
VSAHLSIWHPPEPEPAPEVNPDPTFHEFASQWFEASQGEWRPKTVRDYEWQLTSHLLPFFKNHRLSQITVAEVDRYRQAKVAQNKAIQAAATKGKPQIEEYVDKRGRKHHRPRRLLSVTSIDVPLPDGLTPHKLRHTFASILVALSVDPGSVMDQLGHVDPGFTLRVYRHGMRRNSTAKERLRALVAGTDWAPSGTGAQNGVLADLLMAGQPAQKTAK